MSSDDLSAFTASSVAHKMTIQTPPTRPDIYNVWYNHREPSVQLPQLFAAKYLQSVPSQVILTDPVGNEFTITILKTDYDVLFTNGWKDVGDFYALQPGAWLTMFYTAYGKFNIHITDVKGESIPYPPIKDKESGHVPADPICIEDQSDVVEEEDSTLEIVDRAKMITAVKKNISFEELTGRTLFFCKTWSSYALLESDGRISLVDEYGKVWPCYYKASIGETGNAGINRGWKTFCRQKKLYQGHGSKFGVMTPNANVLYYSPGT